MADLIVISGVKEQLERYNVSSDLYEALDDAVADHIDRAAKRAATHDRRTFQRRDL